jgi:hypothetical protein
MVNFATSFDNFSSHIDSPLQGWTIGSVGEHGCNSKNWSRDVANEKFLILSVDSTGLSLALFWEYKNAIICHRPCSALSDRIVRTFFVSSYLILPCTHHYDPTLDFYRHVHLRKNIAIQSNKNFSYNSPKRTKYKRHFRMRVTLNLPIYCRKVFIIQHA